MKKCVNCGKEYDENEIEYEFMNTETDLSDIGITPGYYRLGKDLCLECAVEEVNNGGYTEICECCGKTFNPVSEEYEFQNLVSNRVNDAQFFDGTNIYCAECAAEKLFETLDEERN